MINRLELLENILIKSRDFFEDYSNSVPINSDFSEFPKGCCGDASNIIGCYLISQGFKNVRYIEGVRKANEQAPTHAWLEWDGWIIDITADQFIDGPSAVFMERDSEFHESFLRQDEWQPCTEDLQDEYLTFVEYMRG